MYGLIVKVGLLGINGEIFSEVMFLFTLRSFDTLYFSRTVGMVPVLFGKSMTHFSKMAVGSENEISGWYCSVPFFDTMKSHHSRIARKVKRSKSRC